MDDGAQVALSLKDRPSWISQPPEDDEKSHYLIGLSHPYKIEKHARQDALRDARISYAHYTGIEVDEVSTVLNALYTSSSQVLDPTVSSLGRHQERTSAQIRRLKAKKWYWETATLSKGKVKESGYQYWVLVEVPHEEYQRVQEWKKSKLALKKKQNEIKSTKTLARAKHLLSESEGYLSSLSSSFSQLNPLRVMNSLHAYWQELYQLRTESEFSKISLDSGKPDVSLKSAQIALLKKMKAIADGIEITAEASNAPSNKKVALNRVSIVESYGEQSSENQLLAVLKLTDQEATYPVQGIPLQLANMDGVSVLSAQTNKEGVSLFDADKLTAGDYRLVIDVNHKSMQFLHKRIKRLLSKKVAIVSVTKKYDLLAVNKLKARPIAIDVLINNTRNNDLQLFEGDEISYQVELDRTAYVLTLFEDAKGNLIQILPGNNKQNSLNQGLVNSINIPEPNADYRLTVSPPFGKETLLVYSSGTPFPTLDGVENGKGLRIVDTTKTKNLLDQYIRGKNKQNESFGMASFSVRTFPKMLSMNE